MVKWTGAEGSLDPRPGGVHRVSPRSHAVMSGKFLEVDPPRRLVFRWGWETELFAIPPQSTIVEVTLTRDDAEAPLHPVHRRYEHGAVPVHRPGLEHYLPRLSLLAPALTRGVDPWRDIAVNLKELQNAGVATRRACSSPRACC
jgi:uncharacterized protein YndB with AHSA1/START domain